MEIPETSKTLNVDAPEFKPCEFPIRSSKSGFSQTSPDNNTAKKTAHIDDEPAAHIAEQEQPDPPEILEQKEPQQAPGCGESVPLEKELNLPKVMTSSSSMESFLTASATDSECHKEEEQSKKKQAPVAAARGIFSETSANGQDERDNTQRLAPNCYSNGYESRPSSLCTKPVTDDTKQVLEGAARALSAGLKKQAESLPTSDQTISKSQSETEQPLKVTTAQDLKVQEAPVEEEQYQDARMEQDEWSLKQTLGEIPRDARKTRVPPLWKYVNITFSDIDVDSGRVYVQMLADELTISQLTDEINEAQATPVPRQMSDLDVGLIVIAPYENRKYRAQIVSKKSENDIEVFFIDYGNRATVRLQDLGLMSNKKVAKICKMAIPCEFDDALKVSHLLAELPDMAYVCFAGPQQRDSDTVYRIMDIMASTKENIQALPDPAVFEARDDPAVLPYSVVVTQATNPQSMWLVESKDMEVFEHVEEMLQKLPPEPCSSQSATIGSHVAYQGKRALVTDRREDHLDLLLIDDGTSVKDVPRSKCRRLPLMAHMMPLAARYASLANCKIPSDGPGVEELMKTYVIGKTFKMKVKDSEHDDVILVDPRTSKYLANMLNSKFAP